MRRPFKIGWKGAVVLVLLALYVAQAWHDDWPGMGASFWHVGAISLDTQVQFGALAPRLVAAGEGHRLVLAPWLLDSLLGALLLTWFWHGVASRVQGFAGGARTFVWMVLAGVAAGIGDLQLRPDVSVPLPLGPFAWILGLLGAQLAWGVFGRTAHARRLRTSALATLFFVAVLQVVFTLQHRSGWSLREDLGDTQQLIALGAGFVLALLSVPGLRAGRTHRLAPWLAGLLAVATVVAGGRQVLRAAAVSEQPIVRAFLDELSALERRAQRIARNPRASSATRSRLGAELARLRARAEAEQGTLALGEEAQQALESYLRAFMPYVTGTVPDPHGVRLQLHRALGAWLEAGEGPLRKRVGLRPRARSEADRWTRQ